MIISFSLQVAILDINKHKGKALEDELISFYGKDHVKFLPCDVTKSDQLFSKNFSNL